MKVLVSVKYPNEISDLYGWWDASDFNNSTSGTDINIWQDKSGNGFDFVYTPPPLNGSQGTPYPRSKKEVDHNGRSILSGMGSYMVNLNLFEQLPVTLFMVFKGNSEVHSVALGSNPGVNFEIIAGTRIVIRQYHEPTNSDSIDDKYNQIAFVMANITNQRYTKINGKNYSTNANQIPSLDKLFLNFRNYSGNAGDFNHCEIIIYNRRLTNQEINLIDRYLKFKWSL